MGQMWTLETLRWTWKGRRWESGKNMNFGDSRSELLTGWKNVSVVFAAMSLQSCPTLCDPTDSSPPGSPVPGFSRQNHWSGLPFPSPMHESEKWKWSRAVMSDSSRPHGLQPTRLLHPWDFPGKSTGVGVPLPSPVLSLRVSISSYPTQILAFDYSHK